MRQYVHQYPIEAVYIPLEDIPTCQGRHFSFFWYRLLGLLEIHGYPPNEKLCQFFAQSVILASHFNIFHAFSDAV